MERKEPTIGSFEAGYAPPASRVDRGDPLNAPRKPWLAVVTALLCTPVAFAYAGRLAWALVWYPVVLVLFVLVGRSGFVQSVAGMWTVLVIGIAAWLAGVALPWEFARAGARRYRLQWYNRWYVYVLLGVVLSVPVSYIAQHKQQFLGFDTYSMPTDSMAPTLKIGDVIVADTRGEVLAALHPGDVVVHLSNTWPDKTFAKRIVAGPGQHVQIDKAGLKVDGRLQNNSHAQGDDWKESMWLKYPDVVLGPDEFYMMGDNRGNSMDSRTEGPVPRANVLGKVTTIYYAKDLARVGKVE